MSLDERVDAMGMLRAQANRTPMRVLCTKAGTRLSACWLQGDDVIVDHKAYRSSANSLDEAMGEARLTGPLEPIASGKVQSRSISQRRSLVTSLTVLPDSRPRARNSPGV